MGDTLTRTMTGRDDLAARIIMGVIAAMVTAVAAATAVGFWLSYGGLHDFAVSAGMTGPEAMAWPASVDLFIVAGEAGVTIGALRHDWDWMATAYFILGFAVSVTGNVLHVYPGGLPWAKYAVAAVPPVAAMLALAALLRQVYGLALAVKPRVKAETVTAVTPVTEPVVTPAPVQAVTMSPPRVRVIAMDPDLFTLSVPKLAAKYDTSDSTVARARRMAGNGKAH